jgi:Ca-activated chloride channel family protein
MYTSSTGEVVRGWSPYEWPRYSPEAMEETLKEVQRCTKDEIRINTFMMANDPALVQFAKHMTAINKGRMFLAKPGRLGNYVLFDYLSGKSKVL